MENEKQRQKFYNFVNTKFINLSIMIVVFIFSCGINFINSCIRKKYDDVVLSQQSLIECKNISGYLKYQHIFAALENIIVIFIGFVIYKLRLFWKSIQIQFHKIKLLSQSVIDKWQWQ